MRMKVWRHQDCLLGNFAWPRWLLMISYKTSSHLALPASERGDLLGAGRTLFRCGSTHQVPTIGKAIAQAFARVIKSYYGFALGDGLGKEAVAFIRARLLPSP